MNAPHRSVMLPEMLEALAPKDGEIYVDGTFGAGGYSRAILEAAKCRVYAIDRDPTVKEFAATLEAQFAGRFVLLTGSFSDMVHLLAEQGVSEVNGIVLDVGVSSMQIDRPERGFSFRHDGPLDMRMAAEGRTAAEVVNGMDEAALADILYHYGEERASRRIARAIVEARKLAPIATTRQLAEIVHRVVRKQGEIDPATRTFQALRIYVNDELGELERALAAGEQLLASGGRLVVVAFHSLEDRMVKQFFESRCGETRGVSRHLPSGVERRAAGGSPNENGQTLPTFFRATRMKVSESEARSNARSRSARLRFALRRERKKEAAPCN